MLFTHSKVFEEHIAPLVLDIGQYHEHAEDHAGDDGDHHHQTAVKHLQCNVTSLWVISAPFLCQHNQGSILVSFSFSINGK